MNISKRPDGKWRAQWKDPVTGRWKAKHFTRKSDAQDYLDGISAAVRSGSYVSPSESKVTVGEFGRRWLDSQTHLKQSTWRRYDALLRVHIVPRLGRLSLADVRHATVTEWVADLHGAGLSAASVRQAHRVLSLLLSHAVDDGRLAANPAVRVKLPKATRSEKMFLTHQQLADLVAAMTAENDQLMTLTLAYAGLRFGEAVGLRVGSLDPLRRTLRVSTGISEVGADLIEDTPKTHQARTVPIPRFLADRLAAMVAGRARSDYLFTAPLGGPVRLSNWRRRVFDKAVRAAGLLGLTPHGLRHSYASLAIESGASILAVSKALGHATPVLTLSTYGHLYPSEAVAVADKLGDRAEAAWDQRGTEPNLILLRKANGAS